MSATEQVCAAPSQQRLRRYSVAAASAPRDAQNHQNERDGAGLRSSVAAPSQQGCAHHERSTGLLGYRLENLPAKTGGTTIPITEVQLQAEARLAKNQEEEKLFIWPPFFNITNVVCAKTSKKGGQTFSWGGQLVS